MLRVKIPLETVKAVCGKCRPEFHAEVLRMGRVEGGFLEIDRETHHRLALYVSSGECGGSSARRFLAALRRWIKLGLPVVYGLRYRYRLWVCSICPQWEGGRGKLGRCRLCGCYTATKLRLATESCPIGRW